jgi:predicted nucleic acid-binding Zn ribbon protein
MEKASEALQRILDLVGEEEGRVLVFLKELWPRIVGSDLARHTTPTALSKGVLTVSVPSEVWKTQLLDVRSKMAGATNRYWNRTVVKEIQFREDDGETE